MTKFIQQRPQARALARRARGRHPKGPPDDAAASPQPVDVEEPDEPGTPSLGTKPAARPGDVEVYHPNRGGTYSLSGETRETPADPTRTVRKPLIAKMLLPALSDELLAYLREHLEGGETHYPPRQGMPELRRRVASELAHLGGPRLDENGVVITAGEGEALFATLMGLGIGAGDPVFVSGDWNRHKELFDVLDVTPIAPGEVESTPAGTEAALQVIFLGKAIPPASNGATLPLPTRSHLIYVGSFDALPEMAPFQLGYVAGPAERISRILPWKEAFSVCSAAPAQRAALFGFASLDDGRHAEETA